MAVSLELADTPREYACIDLTLKPIFGVKDENIESWAATLKILGLSYRANEPVLVHSLETYGVPNNRYDGSAIQAIDDIGPLELYQKDDENRIRAWHCSRPTKGTQVYSFRALPREVNNKTPPGGRTDLRRDLDGGMTAGGISFIPLPPERLKEFRIKFQWDLSNAPAMTRAVWSFGEWDSESRYSVSKLGPADILLNTVYAVGRLHKFTTSTPREDGKMREYGFYWFGQPTLFNAPEIAEKVEHVFVEMARFFEDAELSYRVVVRFNPVRGFGGQAYLRSFILEYDPFVQLQNGEMLSLLVHEMVHNWPRMEGSAHHQTQDEATWYNEGVADYYSIILPYRLTIYDEQEYLRWINMEAIRYYTNPLVSISNDKAVQLAGKTANAQTLFYSRGCMHLIDLNAKIIAANENRSLDDVVLKFLHLRQKKRPHGLAEWLKLMAEENIPSFLEDNENMAVGVLIIPATNSLGSKFKLLRDDLEQFSLGFSEEIFNKHRMIAELDANSRAAVAGLRNGDKVIRNTFMFQSQEHFLKKMALVIEREGNELEVTFWPRTWHKVECWQWYPLEE